MKKLKLLLLVFVLFLTNILSAQTTLTFRFANPRIVHYTVADWGVPSDADYLEFDIQVKAAAAGSYLFSGGANLTFDNSSISSDVNSWIVSPGPLLQGQFNQAGLKDKYNNGYTITGTLPSKVFNIFWTCNNLNTNATDYTRFNEITTSFQNMVIVSAPIIDASGTAGIKFIQDLMNGQQAYKLLADPWYANYINPNIYDPGDFSNTYLGRIYSAANSWTQIGSLVNNTAPVDWATSVNTSVWEGTATITQTDNTAALANNLSIHNSAVLNIPASKWLTVSGTLTSPAASSLVVESGGSLIHSTELVPGTVKTLVSGNTSLTANTYHQVSIPLDALANPVSGLFMGSYLFSFNTAGNSWLALGSPTDTPLDVNKGYLIYYPDASNTYSFAGPMRAGTVSPVLSNAGSGYNSVPNPYPSAIDFTLLTKSNLDDAFWIWNGVTGNYGAYGTQVGSGTSGTSQYIPVGQSFFVKANASGTLAMEDLDRVHSSQAFLKNSQNVENQLRLAVNGNNSGDEVIVAFNDKWSDGSDDADVLKMIGSETSPQLSCVADDDSKLSIDALPFDEGDVIVPLNFALNATTNVTFTASGMETFATGNPIYLEDLELNTVTDLRTTPAYIFSHTKGKNQDRFQLRFMLTTSVPAVSEIQGRIFASNGYLFIDIPAFGQSEVTIGVYDALGRQLSSRAMTLSGVSKIHAPVAIGVYIVRVISGNKTFTGKVLVN